MRKLSGPRLAQEAPDPVPALLGRIHALAPGLDDFGYCDSARETVRFLSQQLKAGEACLARHAHDLLRAQMAECMAACGYVESNEAELLRALKDFASLSGWEFQDGGWVSFGGPRAEREAAHA